MLLTVVATMVCVVLDFLRRSHRKEMDVASMPGIAVRAPDYAEVPVTVQPVIPPQSFP